MGNLCSSQHPMYKEHMYIIPRNYSVKRVLVQTLFGRLVECSNNDTNEIVVIKSTRYRTLKYEMPMLQTLMDYNLDQKNVVKFLGGSVENKYLIFEKLDISLKDYLSDMKGSMYLQDIRTVIQQLATALDGLKAIGVIHTSVTPDHIMLVDRATQPLRVKLIGFRVATYKEETNDPWFYQRLIIRSPEMLLGLPCSEAFDMWSLGCVMATMILGFPLFPWRNKYTLIQNMVNILGPPHPDVIKAGHISLNYFTETSSDTYTLKQVFQTATIQYCSGKRKTKFHSLDDLKKLYQQENNTAEANEWTECINLLKAMLRWDSEDRITPGEVLAHPFITMSYLKHSSDGQSTEV